MNLPAASCGVCERESNIIQLNNNLLSINKIISTKRLLCYSIKLIRHSLIVAYFPDVTYISFGCYFISSYFYDILELIMAIQVTECATSPVFKKAQPNYSYINPNGIANPSWYQFFFGTFHGPFEDLKYHIKILSSNNLGIEIKAFLPTNDTNLDQYHQISSSSLDIDEICNMVMKWNSEGFSILIGQKTNLSQNVKDASTGSLSKQSDNAEQLPIGQKLVLHFKYDPVFINHVDAIKRIIELNNYEFSGFGRILADFNSFYLFVDIPRTESFLQSQKKQYAEQLKSTILNISIRWNLLNNIHFFFQLYNHFFIPDHYMVAAGTKNFDAESPGYAKWIWINDQCTQKQNFHRIMKQKNPSRLLRRFCRILNDNSLDRKASLIQINPIFTNSGLYKLIKENNFINHMFTEERFIHDKNSIHTEAINQAILLRAFCKAGPSIIYSQLSPIRNSIDISPLSQIKNNPKYALGLCVFADEYIDMICAQDNTRIRSHVRFSRMKRTSTHHSIERRQYCIGKKMELTNKFGPSIHYATQGIYLFTLIKDKLEQISFVNGSSNLEHDLTAIPCKFYVPSNPVSENIGALIVPNNNYTGIIEDFNQYRQGCPLLAYFWFYGRQYCLIPVPKEMIEHTPTLEKCLDWLYINRKDIYQIWKRHYIDSNRKKKNL
jgi:hypothetical protein